MLVHRLMVTSWSRLSNHIGVKVKIKKLMLMRNSFLFPLIKKRNVDFYSIGSFS